MRIALRGILAALMALPLACSADTAPEPYRLGQHYKIAREELAPADPARIEVAEAFWYGCPHCHAFEPFVASWLAKKPADVDFVRYPASLGRPIGVLHSKAYFAAESLGVLGLTHKPLFDALHRERQRLDTPDTLRAFFVKTAGIGAEDFDGAFTGFAVDNRVRKSEQALRELGVSSVPVTVVELLDRTESRTGKFWRLFAPVSASPGSLAVTPVLPRLIPRPPLL